MVEPNAETKGVLLIAGMLVACMVMVGVSFLMTPMNSGVPAAFGSLIQPLIWLLAVGCTALVTVLFVPLLIIVSVQSQKARDWESCRALHS
jgi:uncharacterized membrane protein YkgB